MLALMGFFSLLVNRSRAFSARLIASIHFPLSRANMFVLLFRDKKMSYRLQNHLLQTFYGYYFSQSKNVTLVRSCTKASNKRFVGLQWKKEEIIQSSNIILKMCIKQCPFVAIRKPSRAVSYFIV